MSTTSLIIEFLITGIQVVIWLILLVLCIFGTEWVSLERFKGYEVAASILLLPIAYPIGIFVDNLADHLLKSRNKKIREVYLKDESESVMCLLIRAKNDWLASYFDYSRVRIRISRSTALNFLLITIILPLFVIIRLRSTLGNSTWWVAITGLIGSAAITILALWSWQHITHTLYKRLVSAYECFSRVEKSFMD